MSLATDTNYRTILMYIQKYDTPSLKTSFAARDQHTLQFEKIDWKMACDKDGLSRTKNINLIKDSWRISLERNKRSGQPTQRNTQWQPKKSGLIKRKEPRRFIVRDTCYQNYDNKRIQRVTFVKVESKSITLPFCGLQNREKKEKTDF